MAKPTEADLNKAFNFGPDSVTMKELITLYGSQVDLMDALIRDEIPHKYRDAVWEQFASVQPLLVRAISLLVKAWEVK